MFDIKQWCADESDPRDYLREPFQFDGKFTATNGHVLIRTPYKGDQLNECSERIAGTLKNVFSELDQLENKLREADLRDMEARQFIRDACCEECGGDRQVHVSNDFNEYEVDCKSCNATGRLAETGHFYAYQGVYVDQTYFNLLKDLTGLSLYGMNDRVYFNANEGSGVIMGIRQFIQEPEIQYSSALEH